MSGEDVVHDNTVVIRMMSDLHKYIGNPTQQLKQDDTIEKESPPGNRTGVSNTSCSILDVTEAFAPDMPRSAFEKYQRALTAELVSVEAKVVQLESELAFQRNEKACTIVELEKNYTILKQGKIRDDEKYADLQQKLRYVVEREKATKEQLQQCKKNLDAARGGPNQKFINLQREKHKLEAELNEVKQTTGNIIAEHELELQRKDSEIATCVNQLEEMKAQQRQLLKRQRTTANRQQQEEDLKLKLAVAEHRNRELEEKISRLHEAEFVSKSISSSLSKLSELEAENRRLIDDNNYLRSTTENTLLYKEKADGLETALARANDRFNELLHVEALNEELTSKLKRWEAFAINTAGVLKSPEEYSVSVAEQQQREAVLTQQMGEVKASNHVYKERCANQQQEIDKLKESEQQPKSNIKPEILRKLQKKLVFVMTERDGYKRIIDTYDSEMTINYQSLERQRLAELQSMLDAYKKRVEQLEADAGLTLQVGKQEVAGAAVDSSSVAREVLELKQELEKLTAEKQKLAADKEAWEMRTEQRSMQGDYDPRHTKVVHFERNPAAISTQRRAGELEALRGECEMLRARVLILEAGGSGRGDVLDLTAQVQEKVQGQPSSKQVDEVKNQLQSLELKNKRLIEAFRKTSQEFREVCYMLLGYQIDMPCNSQYRLRSMYAESPDDHLLFQIQHQNKEGLQLLESEYMKTTTVKELMDTYLKQSNSIPAFLSSLTLDLFNKQTTIFA
ncbi:PREDICTED: mitotic spindle assembly checkpoint protein MAD1-like [Priapulus caudatus]|uniref:Mitotic spindle assembly checkpoint protein MAD1-like n=1 Tax=Priapulus caudatus TaxID=37621 RepID=A0ABM1E5X9_PRICU|nr:PREDICTED: mitotic spindle assembly checkpoint protein MAD1-like [Priapulus caudatus]